MQVNLSLILNILLLVAVVVAIGGLLRARRQARFPASALMDEPVSSASVPASDDVIAVRRIDREPVLKQIEPITAKPKKEPPPIEPKPSKQVLPADDATPLVIFICAEKDKSFAGYDLLQSLLAAGLRFGEGGVFHRHQYENGQGPLVCSLASATASGTFDMQNMGAISVRGLCLYMQPCGNPGIDNDRFDLMMQVATQLSDDLNGLLLDDQRKPWTDGSLRRYRHRLMVTEVI